MPDLLVRGLSADAIARLKTQAARNGRSMQAEAKSIIEGGVKPTVAEWLERVDRSRERIEAQHGALPDSSADIIRDLRDERRSR
ncbi:MAG: hypothetical protein Q8K99_09975 [Actinomycetota bacterium]|nr:hypothetical protein [Actinomycetota bacterium]